MAALAGRAPGGVKHSIPGPTAVLAVALVAGLAAGPAPAAGPGTALTAGDDVYWQRHRALQASDGAGDVDTYSPTEAVAGDHDGFMAVAPERERSVPEAALSAARDYAARNRSSSLLVWHRGRLQSADYWGGDAGSEVNSRSLHKMLGGLLVGAAIRDGHIRSLDDPVAKYIAEWQDTPKAAITIRNVLQMSSGLMWFGPGGPGSIASRRYLHPYWDRVLLEEIPLEFTPGSAWDYSDITADVMPHLIERATGRRYAEYLGDAILKPLRAPGGRIWINREGGMPHGGCCLMLPPEAWLRIGIMAMNGGRVGERQLLPDDWAREMRRPSSVNPHFGLMTWLGQPYTQRRLFHRPDSPANARPRPGAFHSEPFLADDLFLFDGMNGQIVWIVPSQQLVIVRTGLRPPPGQPEWDNAWIPNVILRSLAATGPTPAPRAALPPPPAKPPADPQDESRFQQRWATIRAQTPLTLPGWLDATETVRGAFRGDAPFRPARELRIDAAALASAEAYAERTGSASLLVWQDGALEYERYWGGRGPDDVSETYSMAKSVTALAVGCAVADGAIASVDDAVARYLPEWRGTVHESVTIRQLLHMTSGLRHERFDYSPGQDPRARGLRAFLGPDLESAALAFPLEDVPGAVFNYNSINTQLLLAVVERATGRRYADYVAQRLWQPLGAKDARLWLDRPGGTARAYSYFVARPRDWLRLGALVAGRGRVGDRQVLPASWIDAMTTPSPNNPDYGFQLWLGSPATGKRTYNRNTGIGATHSVPYVADDVVFFDGGGGHRVYVVPSRRLVIVRTGSTNRADWDDAILPNAILAGLPAQPSESVTGSAAPGEE